VPVAVRVGGWTLQRELGRGSRGISWLAVNGAGVEAVLKIFEGPELDRIDVPSLERLATIRHPNVAELIDYGTDAQGRPYVVTRFVDGVSLERYLADRGRLDSEQVLALGVAIARALGAIHALELVHRDVKPANIIVPDNGNVARATLVDFDLIGERRTETGRTQSGVIVGSPAYFAPEQVFGMGLTARVDLWALGIVLYECAVGSRPFDGDGFMTTLIAIAKGPEPDLSLLPPNLRQPVGQALTRDVEARVPDARTFERELLAAMSTRASADIPEEGFARSPPLPTAARARSDAAPPASSLSPLAVPQSQILELHVPAAPAVAEPAGRGWLRAAALPLSLAALLALGLASFWLRWVPLGALLAALGAVSVGLVTAYAVRRIYAALQRRSRTSAMLADVAQKQDVTASIAITVRELAARYNADPRARLLTESMALVLEQYQSVEGLDPEKKLDTTLAVLETMMRLEARITEVSPPWHERHEKAVTLVGALGTACATWWGIAQGASALGQKQSAELIAGCPLGEVSTLTPIRLQAVDGVPLTWSLGGRDLLIGASFDWPKDANVPVSPGTYPIRVARSSAPSESHWCVIQVH
jgi:hypothetical protein